MSVNPFVNPQANSESPEPASETTSEQPESDAVTREEFNALKQEFNDFKQKTEALTKTPPPMPESDSSSSLVEYLPFALIGFLLALVLFLIYRISEVRGAFRKLERDFNDYKKKSVTAEKKTVESYSSSPVQKILVNNPPPPASERAANVPAGAEKNNMPAQAPAAISQKPASAQEFLVQCIKDFNATGEENSKLNRRAFAEKYNVLAFSCTNAKERLDHYALKPQFGGTSSVISGGYWAVRLEEGRYAVFPNIRAYNWLIRDEQAMDYFFDELNFDSGNTYNKIFVVSPAIMDGEFRCIRKGKLKLSNG